MVERATDNHSQIETFSDKRVYVTCQFTFHRIKSIDLEGVSEEICENISSLGVVSVRWIKVRRNNELVPTNTLILTVNMPSLPQSAKAGYLNIPAVQYIPIPL